jgi:molybdopterin converting factor subunit 1
VTIRLLHFASFRDIAGKVEEIREVPAGTTVASLWKELCAEIAGFARLRGMPPAAVNADYANGNTLLADGDEVAFLPPVAGG